MSDLLLQLLQQRFGNQAVQKASGAKGGEWHSPCPGCGGTDRFMSFPEQAGGELCAKHGITGTWACRAKGSTECSKGGDMLDFMQRFEGKSFKEACEALGITLDKGNTRSRAYRPLREPQQNSAGSPYFVPGTFNQPPAIWCEHATRLALAAHECLLQSPHIMSWLGKRGLDEEAVRRYRLGYIEGENGQPYRYRALKSWGLEPYESNGKKVTALWIPRGVTIPVWGSDGQCWRVRIRRRDVDLTKPDGGKRNKYALITQPGKPYSAPLMLPPVGVTPDMATWVIVEAELDALAIHHACKGRVGVISILSVRVKPDAPAHAMLRKSARILVALDYDQDKEDGSNPGADAWPWWKNTYPQARCYPVPVGKDPGEAYAQGVDLAAWVFEGAPLAAVSKGGTSRPSDAYGPNPSGQSVSRCGVPAREGEDGSVGAKNCRSGGGEGEGKTAAARMWAVPSDVQAFEDMPLPQRVHHSELLSAFVKRGFDAPDCLVPCARTKPSFWWVYYAKGCKGCSGHPQCLLGVLRSDVFQRAVAAEKERVDGKAAN